MFVLMSLFTLSVKRCLQPLSVFGGQLSYIGTYSKPMQKEERIKDSRNSRFKLAAAKYNRNGDVFGTIGADEECVIPLKSEALPDDEDGYDYLEINRDRKHILYYKYKLTNLIHGNPGKARIVEALKLFDTMRREDRKKVRPYMYTLLISGAAENGYTSKAFELFEEALKKKLKPTLATFTALFNSCAECPFKEMGLQKAEWLRRWLYEVGTVLGQTHYHAMIKAFGRHGDIKTVYQLVDEMVEKEIAIDTVTFNHLLMAAISQPEIGFGEAIKLYRRMRFHKVPRELNTYHLLLRAAKDCAIGDKENFKKLLHEWLHMDRVLYSERRPRAKIIKSKSSQTRINFSNDIIYEYLPDGNVKKVDLDENAFADKNINQVTQSSPSDSKELTTNKDIELLSDKPNFLISSKFARMSNIIDIDYESLSDRKNRFLLIGGLEGFLHLLDSEHIKPDIKTFTMILDLIPRDNEIEDNLLSYLNQSKIKPDTGFFNQIIKRRCFRGDVSAAKKTFIVMQRNNVPVDLATFGVLASGCKNVTMANQLLQDLSNAGFRPNIQIMGALMKKACLSKDIFTMRLVMKKMSQFSIHADRRIIDALALTIEEIDRILWAIEKGKQKPFGHFANPEYAVNFNQLKSFFEKWAANTEIEIPHPWDQFKYDRQDWSYLKMRNYEKEMKSRILNRSDIQKSVKAGQKVNVDKLVHDF